MAIERHVAYPFAGKESIVVLATVKEAFVKAQYQLSHSHILAEASLHPTCRYRQKLLIASIGKLCTETEIAVVLHVRHHSLELEIYHALLPSLLQEEVVMSCVDLVQSRSAWRTRLHKQKPVVVNHN